MTNTRTKRTCAYCANFALIQRDSGWGECRFGRALCRGFAGNAACKGFLSQTAATAANEPKAGEAPFCGDFAKCSPGRECGECREFEIWMCAREKNQ